MTPTTTPGTVLELAKNSMHSILLFSGQPAFAASLFDQIWRPLLGGAAIGVAAALLLGTIGRIAGVSGILGGLLPWPKVNTYAEVRWRLAFLAGLFVIGILTHNVSPDSLTNTAPRSTATLAIAGLLVGLGTRLGNGCTSGHAVCGISRGSVRSFVATATFIATGALTVAVVRVVGGSS